MKTPYTFQGMGGGSIIGSKNGKVYIYEDRSEPHGPLQKWRNDISVFVFIYIYDCIY